MMKIFKGILAVIIGVIALPFIALWYLCDLVWSIGDAIVTAIFPDYIESVEESDGKKL